MERQEKSHWIKWYPPAGSDGEGDRENTQGSNPSPALARGMDNIFSPDGLLYPHVVIQKASSFLSSGYIFCLILDLQGFCQDVWYQIGWAEKDIYKVHITEACGRQRKRCGYDSHTDREKTIL